ncbi:MAG: phosphatase PAP2 family protein [Muribaculaceae bacterium]|nr:phosphatase PAP2 family protein [Muribaculaceae bacterium]
MPPGKLQRTSFQKGIGVSTDVLALALPAGAIIATAINGDWEGMTQIGFTALVAGGTNLLLKYTVRELRPDYSNYHSFPSLHSTAAFASAAYLQRRYGWKFGGPAYAVATYVAVGRVMAKKHHWWDCVVGAAIGAGSAYLFTTPWAKKHEFAVVPVANEEYIGVATSFNF